MCNIGESVLPEVNVFTQPLRPFQLLDPSTLVEPSRFDMALARVGRAGVRCEDVRQCYLSLVTRKERDIMVLKSTVGEVFLHLRSALDYCTAELRDRHSTLNKKGEPRKVYFPVADTTATSSDFLAELRKNIPGLPASVESKLDGFQHYHDVENVWLPRFRVLSNQDKHERLCLQTIQMSGCASDWATEEVEGRPVLRVKTEEADFLNKEGVIIARRHGAQQSGGAAYSLTFAETGDGVESFLRRARDGVKHIVETLKPDIS